MDTAQRATLVMVDRNLRLYFDNVHGYEQFMEKVEDCINYKNVLRVKVDGKMHLINGRYVVGLVPDGATTGVVT